MCGIIGVIDRGREAMDGSAIRRALSMMNERGSGEGAGYVAYGVYPEFRDYFALHVFFDNIHETKPKVDALLHQWGRVVHDEEIPTYDTPRLRKVHTPWRYFFKPDVRLMPRSTTPAEEIVTELVMRINTAIEGALVFSSGRNLGVFKAAGWPEEVADFYRIEEYEGHCWLAHNRYPTNTPGWWGGAHPFNLLDWSVVHNGEITDYGTNRRYIESFGYKCTMFTDTEVVAYLVDLLVRRHGLPAELAVTALAPPFWDEIDAMEGDRAAALPRPPAHLRLRDDERAVRDRGRGPGLDGRVHGPLQAPAARRGRGRRPALRLVEEAAIRAMEPNLDRVFMPRAGEPIVGRCR